MTPLLAYARTRSELQSLGVDVSAGADLEEVIAQLQARITQVATGKREHFDRELFNDLLRFWQILSAAANAEPSQTA